MSVAAGALGSCARTQLSSSLHHQARSALGDVRENGLTAVQPNGVAEIDGEHEVHDGSSGEAERTDLEKRPHGGEVSRSASMQTAAWYRKIDRGGYLVSFQQTSFHLVCLLLLLGTPLRMPGRPRKSSAQRK